MTCNAATNYIDKQYTQDIISKVSNNRPDDDFDTYSTIMDSIVNNKKYLANINQMHTLWKTNRECTYFYAGAFRKDCKISLYNAFYDGLKDYPSYKSYLESSNNNDDLYGIEYFDWAPDDGFSSIKDQILESNSTLYFQSLGVMTIMYPWFVSDEGYQVYINADISLSNIDNMVWNNWFIVLIPIIIILVIIFLSCFIMYTRQLKRENFLIRKNAKNKRFQRQIQKEKTQMKNMAIALAKNTYRVVYVDFDERHMYKVDTNNNTLVFNDKISVPEYSQYFINKYVLPQYRDRLNELYDIDYLIKAGHNGEQNIEYEYVTRMTNDNSRVTKMKLCISIICDDASTPVSAIISYIELDS